MSTHNIGFIYENHGMRYKAIKSFILDHQIVPIMPGKCKHAEHMYYVSSMHISFSSILGTSRWDETSDTSGTLIS